jgi:hypothetical protein
MIHNKVNITNNGGGEAKMSCKMCSSLVMQITTSKNAMQDECSSLIKQNHYIYYLLSPCSVPYAM